MSRFSACNVDHNTIKLFYFDKSLGDFQSRHFFKKAQHFISAASVNKSHLYCVRQFQKLAFLVEKK